MAVQNEIRFPMQGEDYTPPPDKLKEDQDDGHVYAHSVVTICGEPEDLYRLWRHEESLPLWREGVASVTRTGEVTSHWVMHLPGTQKTLEFDGRVTEDIPGQKVATVVTSGPAEGSTDLVTFAKDKHGRGTVVTYVCDFVVPGGTVTNAIAAMVARSPRQMTIENLRHFKQLAESHEIPNVTGQPAGKRGLMGTWKQFLMGENNPTPPGSSRAA